MKFNPSALASVAAVALISLGSLAQADSNVSASAQAVFSMDNANTVNVNISANKYTPDAGTPYVSGSVVINGTSGSVNASINARVSDVSFSKKTVNGISYDAAHITTKSFWFIDLKTKQRTISYAVVDVTKKGRGMLCYQVFSAADNSVLSSTSANDALMDAPFISGSTSLLLPQVAPVN